MSDPQLRTETEVVKVGDQSTTDLPRAARLLSAKCFGVTDRGMVRPANEDQFLVATLIKMLEVQQSSLPQPAARHSHDHSYLLVVADGVGGAQAGEQASALAIDSVETYVLETVKWFAHCRGDDTDQLLSEFRRALGQAHRQVRGEAAKHPSLRGMGTTLTLAYSVNDEMFVAHVGDSRCYLFRGGSLYRLTQDHTPVEEMIKRGAIKPEDAAGHRWRHVITSTVGGDSPNVRIDVHKLTLEPQDVILLCSDGLTEMLSNDDIVRTLAEQSDPEACCRRLIEQANAAGGKDNITVVIAAYQEESP
jgi:protein phosphatase